MYSSPPCSCVVQFSHLCKMSFVKTCEMWLCHWRKSDIHPRWQQSSAAICWALPLSPPSSRLLQDLLCCRGEQTQCLGHLWVGLPGRDRDFGVSSTLQLLYHGLALYLENIWRFRDQTYFILPKQLLFQHGVTENHAWKITMSLSLSPANSFLLPGYSNLA